MDATHDAVSDGELDQNQIADVAAGADEPDLFDQTIIVPGGDLSDHIQQVSGNVFEDTLPGTITLEATAIGLPAEKIAPSTHKLVGLSAAQRCHIGNVRNRNEDSSFIFTAEFGHTNYGQGKLERDQYDLDQKLTGVNPAKVVKDIIA